MSRERPTAACRDLAWPAALALSDAGQLAVEDYARALLRAADAETLLDPSGRASGVHVCGLAAEPAPAARADLEAFARDLAQREDGGGLGWS